MPAPSLIEVLETMIAEPFRFPATGGFLVLQEAGQDDFPLRIGLRQFAMRIDLPHSGDLDDTFPFLKRDVASLTCKCDLISFIPRDGVEPLILVIELKTLNEGHYLKQLRASREFVLYLVGLMKIHGLGEFKPEIKGVLIKSRRIPAKGTTRPKTTLEFEPRHADLPVCECDRSRPLSLTDLKRAAEKT